MAPLLERRHDIGLGDAFQVLVLHQDCDLAGGTMRDVGHGVRVLAKVEAQHGHVHEHGAGARNGHLTRHDTRHDGLVVVEPDRVALALHIGCITVAHDQHDLLRSASAFHHRELHGVHLVDDAAVHQLRSQRTALLLLHHATSLQLRRRDGDLDLVVAHAPDLDQDLSVGVLDAQVHTRQRDGERAVGAAVVHRRCKQLRALVGGGDGGRGSAGLAFNVHDPHVVCARARHREAVDAGVRHDLTADSGVLATGGAVGNLLKELVLAVCGAEVEARDLHHLAAVRGEAVGVAVVEASDLVHFRCTVVRGGSLRQLSVDGHLPLVAATRGLGGVADDELVLVCIRDEAACRHKLRASRAVRHVDVVAQAGHAKVVAMDLHLLAAAGQQLGVVGATVEADDGVAVASPGGKHLGCLAIHLHHPRVVLASTLRRLARNARVLRGDDAVLRRELRARGTVRHLQRHGASGKNARAEHDATNGDVLAALSGRVLGALASDEGDGRAAVRRRPHGRVDDARLLANGHLPAVAGANARRSAARDVAVGRLRHHGATAGSVPVKVARGTVRHLQLVERLQTRHAEVGALDGDQLGAAGAELGGTGEHVGDGGHSVAGHEGMRSRRRLEICDLHAPLQIRADAWGRLALQHGVGREELAPRGDVGATSAGVGHHHLLDGVAEVGAGESHGCTTEGGHGHH